MLVGLCIGGENENRSVRHLLKKEKALRKFGGYDVDTINENERGVSLSVNNPVSDEVAVLINGYNDMMEGT